MRIVQSNEVKELGEASHKQFILIFTGKVIGLDGLVSSSRLLSAKQAVLHLASIGAVLSLPGTWW